MSLHVPHRIGLRLIVPLGVVLAACGAVTAYFTAHTLSEYLLDETQTGTLRMVDAVTRSTRYDMLNTRWEDVHKTIERLGQQEGLEHVRIFNKDGKVMYSSDAEEISTVVDRNAEACTQCHAEAEPLTRLEHPNRSRIFQGKNGHRVLASIGAIYNEPSCWTAACHVHPESQSVLGVLDIGVSLEATDRRVASAKAWAAGIGIASTLLICVLAGVFVHRLVHRPVKKLLAGVRRVSAGDLEATIAVTSTDEIGELAASFNRMTGDLARARGELHDWGETLERQVQEKTADLRTAQAQVVRAEKMSSLGILAAGVAHELNSPLTGILTFSHLLLQKTPEGSQEREDLELIVNETNRCAAIIRQLLDFSRDGKPEKKPQSLNSVIRRAVALVEHQALFHDVNIECHVAPGLPEVHLDANQMEQVFLNLLVNAAEAMPDGGAVTITCRLDDTTGERVVVTVQDEGTGVPGDLIGKIFDPFFSSKTDGGGTGLGLAVTYGIVRKHGGTIEVESTSGAGTTFTITLPAVVPEMSTP